MTCEVNYGSNGGITFSCSRGHRISTQSQQWNVGDKVVANVPGEGYLSGVIVGIKGASKYPYAYAYRLRVAKRNALTGGMFTCELGKLIFSKELAERMELIAGLDAKPAGKEG